MFPRVRALVGHTPFLGRRWIGDMVALPRLPPVEAVSVNDISIDVVPVLIPFHLQGLTLLSPLGASGCYNWWVCLLTACYQLPTFVLVLQNYRQPCLPHRVHLPYSLSFVSGPEGCNVLSVDKACIEGFPHCVALVYYV